MTMTTAPNPSSPPGALEFAVDRDRCIGCIACVNVFPRIFRMDGDRAVAHAPAGAGEVAPSRVLLSCPVGAIRRLGAATGTKPASAPALEVVPGWEDAWEAHLDDPEDLLERERRYGRVYHASMIEGCFVLRIELPRRAPNHELLYRYGIPLGAPEYDCTLLPVGPSTVSVRARLLDQRLHALAGSINSCPPGLKVDYRFPKPIAAAFCRLDLQDIWVYAIPVGAGDPMTKLATVVRENLARI